MSAHVLLNFTRSNKGHIQGYFTHPIIGAPLQNMNCMYEHFSTYSFQVIKNLSSLFFVCLI